MKYLYIISSDIYTVITNHVLRNHHWNAGADEIMIKEMRVFFLEVRGGETATRSQHVLTRSNRRKTSRGQVSSFCFRLLKGKEARVVCWR